MLYIYISSIFLYLYLYLYLYYIYFYISIIYIYFYIYVYHYMLYIKLKNLSRDNVSLQVLAAHFSSVSIHAGSDAGHELLISTPFTMYYRLTNFETMKRLF